MMYGYGWNYGMPHFITLIFWVVIIAIVISLFRRRNFVGGSCCGYMENKALEILKERYAKGEINKHEFEEKKKDLM